MATTPPYSKSLTILEGPELHPFLEGYIDEPEERVARKGVPDYKLRYREPRSGDRLWRDNKQKILHQSSIRTKSQKFDYEKLRLSANLGQIRLLRVEAAKKSLDAMVCQLLVKNLVDVKNKFEALSYCWGDEEPEATISIRSLSRTQTGYQFSQPEDFPVRRNLLSALRHLRRKNCSILLWVDAICINQRQTPQAQTEKNQQLSMMSEIYNSAKNVCIWLGQSDDQTKAAFTFVKRITNFQMLERYLRPGRKDEEKAETEEENKEEEDSTIVAQWRGLVKTLKETQWFSRRWIIQEIASARSASVHFGDDTVHWDDLAVAISLLQENYSNLERQFGEPLLAEVPSLSATQLVKALSKVCRKSSEGEISERLLDFETLVCTFQQFQARFPQDVIHSVRALAKDAPGRDDPILSVDKTKSTRDLFIAFVRRCIEHSGSLDIICRHWAPPVMDTAGEHIVLPSWISELSNGPFGLPGNSSERQNGENFVAISPGYNWKRYNASNQWQAPVPDVSSSPNVNTFDPSYRWSTGNSKEANYRPVVTDSPTAYSFPLSVSDDTQGGAEEHNGWQNQHGNEDAPQSFVAISSVKRTPVLPSVPGTDQYGRGHLAGDFVTRMYDEKPHPLGHRRAATFTHLSTVPEKPEKRVDGWKLAMNASRFPKRLQAQIEELENAPPEEKNRTTTSSRPGS